MKSSGTSARKRQERFHGAFTGGFSAGFFNSVGSAEGWTPSTFTSSRDKRAAPQEQRPEDFMDDEDGLLTEQLQAKPQFDTLGSTAAEVARKYAEKESAGGAIPGPAPSELIMPVGDPMGKKLLRTMGWREGQGVGSRVRKRKRPAVAEGHESPDEDLPEQARAGLGEKAKALVDREGLTFAPRNADVKAQSISVKTTLHGVGYDPFKNAPEFGSAHSVRGRGVDTRGVYRTDDVVQATGDVSGQTRPFKAPPMSRGSHGFILDDGEDDVYEAGSGKEAYDDVLDAEVCGIGPADKLAGTAKAWASGGLGGKDESVLSARRYARCPSDGRLPPTGFVVAQRPDLESKYWAPPIPPTSFNPIHKFEEDNIENPLRILKKAPRTTPGMDALGRAALLGEPGLQSGTHPTAPPPVPPTQGDMPLVAAGASVFSILSPAARNKLLDAANGVRAPTSSLTIARGAQPQQGSSLRNEGPQNVLANKFTSEAPANINTGATPAVSPGGLVSSTLPAGLTLRTSATSSIPSAVSSLTKPPSGETPKPVQHPVRSTLPWRPAPLLCKRLNVPVPSTPGGFDLARKDGLLGAKMVFTQEQAVSQSISKFVPDSSAARLAKVPLLQGIEHHQPAGVAKEPGAPGLATVDEDPPAERPDIDLFKSIFESESESESEPDSDSRDQVELQPPVQPPGLTASSLPLPAREGARAEGLTSKRGRQGYASDSSEDSSSRRGSDGGAGLVESNVSSAVGSTTAKKKDEGHESRRHRERQRSPSSDSGRESRNNRKRSTSKHKHKKKDKSAKKDKHRKHHKRKRKY